MNLRILHVVVLILLKVTLKGSWQVQPPFCPCTVTIGIPAMHSASISLMMVRRDTSNFALHFVSYIL